MQRACSTRHTSGQPNVGREGRQRTGDHYDVSSAQITHRGPVGDAAEEWQRLRADDA